MINKRILRLRKKYFFTIFLAERSPKRKYIIDKIITFSFGLVNIEHVEIVNNSSEAKIIYVCALSCLVKADVTPILVGRVFSFMCEVVSKN